mmetsp:Transcript_25108/g.61945  ORF Transcript_25108/g.61945 Transcript_25108/m.61945 type:complete len:290 (+) Transcript_25108:100-969(+)
MSTLPGAGASISSTSPVSHPTSSLAPSSDHEMTVAGPGTATNPMGSRPYPPSTLPPYERKNTVPSADAVASTFPEGLNAAAVTAILCGLMQLAILNVSAQRITMRTTPSLNPTTAVRPLGSTSSGAMARKLAGAVNDVEKIWRRDAYEKSRTVPSAPAVTAWSLTAETSNAVMGPAWKVAREREVVAAPSSPSSATRTSPPFSSCTTQWSASSMMMLLMLTATGAGAGGAEEAPSPSAPAIAALLPPPPTVTRTSSMGSMNTVLLSSPGSASLMSLKLQLRTYPSDAAV